MYVTKFRSCKYFHQQNLLIDVESIQTCQPRVRNSCPRMHFINFANLIQLISRLLSTTVFKKLPPSSIHYVMKIYLLIVNRFAQTNLNRSDKNSFQSLTNFITFFFFSMWKKYYINDVIPKKKKEERKKLYRNSHNSAWKTAHLHPRITSAKL